MLTTDIKNIRNGMKNLVIKAKVMGKEIDADSSKPLFKALISDGTGEIILNLWRNQIEQVKVGDTIVVKDGFVKLWKGQLELNTWSKIEVIQVKDV